MPELSILGEHRRSVKRHGIANRVACDLGRRSAQPTGKEGMRGTPFFGSARRPGAFPAAGARGDRALPSVDAANLALPPASLPTADRAIQVHNAYLVVETAEGVVIIDQHALHERILYEELRQRLAERKLESQRTVWDFEQQTLDLMRDRR